LKFIDQDNFTGRRSFLTFSEQAKMSA